MGQKVQMPAGMVVDTRVCPSCNTGHSGRHPCSPSQVDPPPVPRTVSRTVRPSPSQGGGGFSFQHVAADLDQWDLFLPRFIQQPLPLHLALPSVADDLPPVCLGWAKSRAEWLRMRDEAMAYARVCRAQGGLGESVRVWVEHARDANRTAIERGRWARGM